MAVVSITKEERTLSGAKIFVTTIAEHKGPFNNRIIAREPGNTSERSQKHASEKYHDKKTKNR